MRNTLHTIDDQALARALGGFRLGEFLGVTGGFAATGALSFGTIAALSRLTPRRVAIGRGMLYGGGLYAAGGAALDLITQARDRG